MQSYTFFILFGTVISTLEVELLMAERERKMTEREGERERGRERGRERERNESDH